MARRYTRRQLEQLAESLEPAIRDAFLASIRSQRETAAVTVIAELIEAGQTEAIAEILGVNAARYATLTEAVRNAFIVGGVQAATEIPPLVMSAPTLTGPWRTRVATARVQFNFDVRNPAAERWLATNSARLVQDIVTSQREAIRTTVTAGMAAGQGPRQTALDIVGRIGESGRRSGGIVGLSNPQSQYVASARAELLSGDRAQMAHYLTRERRDRRFDAAVRKAMAEGRGLSKDDTDKIVGRYSDRLLQLRAEVIARTESLTAMSAARFESYRQAIEAGDLDPNDVETIWGATMDKRTRDQHRALNGQSQAFGSPFVAPDGDRMLYPGDVSMGAGPANTIQCRCSQMFRIRQAA